MLWHLAWHYPNPVPTGWHSIVIPSVAASLPYLIRARQCLIMYTIGFMKVSTTSQHSRRMLAFVFLLFILLLHLSFRQNDPKKYQHMLNAVKYSTSLWPLCVSAYEKTVESPEEKATLEKILIALLA